MLKLNLLIAGHVCIDRNIIDGTMREGWGSTAMYISHYLKDKENINSYVLASYGNDFIPYKSSTNFINKGNDSETMIYENIVINGSRSQYCRNYENSQLPKITNKVKGSLYSADILIIAPMVNRYPVDYVNSILKETSNDCLKVLLPQGYMRTVEANGNVRKREFLEAPELLDKFNLVVLSNEDADDSLNLALRWTKSHDNLLVVVTKAEKGADFIKNGTAISIPTTPIPFDGIINPVGSGDIFSSNLSIALKQNPHDPVDSIGRANIETGIYLKKSGSE